MSRRITRSPWHPILGAAFIYAQDSLEVSVAEICSHRRQRHLVHARALFVWIAKTFGPDWMSYPIIAFWLGDRCHTSILHMNREIVADLRKNDPNFLRLCDRFAEEFQQQKEAA